MAFKVIHRRNADFYPNAAAEKIMDTMGRDAHKSRNVGEVVVNAVMVGGTITKKSITFDPDPSPFKTEQEANAKLLLNEAINTLKAAGGPGDGKVKIKVKTKM